MSSADPNRADQNRADPNPAHPNHSDPNHADLGTVLTRVSPDVADRQRAVGRKVVLRVEVARANEAAVVGDRDSVAVRR